MLLKIYFSKLFLIILSASFICNVNCNNVTTIKVDVTQNGRRFHHFWKNSGLCPLNSTFDERDKPFLVSSDEKFNLVYIGALPNRSIRHLRVHWLLNLVQVRNSTVLKTYNYNFTYLDEFLDFMIDQKLHVGFEIMGIPKGIKPPKTYNFWYDLVYQLVSRYRQRYGTREVARWRFESWNEPDLQSYNILNFTLNEYLTYVRASKDAIRDVFLNTLKSEVPKFGGPAGIFGDSRKHPLCWGVLESCDVEMKNCPLDYLSFHKKGDGNASLVLERGLELMRDIYFKYPNLRQLPMVNDEADIEKNWSKSEEWRADVTYAAMIIKVIVLHFKVTVLKLGIRFKVLSNDNAFLDYHPFHFTQRTLLARFQMNFTNPPHLQFIKKPSYSVMTLLSLLEDDYLPESVLHPDPSLSFIASRSRQNSKNAAISVLVSFLDDGANDAALKGVRIALSRLNSVSWFNASAFAHVIYLMDNAVTNPYALWRAAGSPPYPTRALRDSMRKVEEPVRLIGPVETKSAQLKVDVVLKSPSVLLLRLCPTIGVPPGRVTRLRAYNVTRNEVLLVWKDNRVKSKCILTYEVEFAPEKETTKENNDDDTVSFRRVNKKDTIFLSFHFSRYANASSGEATKGLYRVRAVDYWNVPGRYSRTIQYSN